MASVMHKADRSYSIWSTWCLHRLATDVPFIACVIDSPSTFTYYLDISNFILESGLSYFKVLTICLLLVYFVGAAGCHCFDLYELDGFSAWWTIGPQGYLKSCNFFNWLHCTPKLKDTAFS